MSARFNQYAGTQEHHLLTDAFSLATEHIHITRMCDVCILNKKTLINLKHFVTS